MAAATSDEGWTRWIMEQFQFPAVPIMDAEIKKGDLNGKFDVIVFPEDSTATITGEAAATGGRGGGGGRGGERDAAEAEVAFRCRPNIAPASAPRA